MFVNFNGLFNKGDRVAVALSGGKDSMALLNVLLDNAHSLDITVLALNVEHGIRGKDSIDDSLFVKEYCAKRGISLISYAVDCIKTSKEQKLSLEQAGRKLRYECFFDAIKSGKCDKVATAHHQSDNAESILFNLLRGSASKGLCGIERNFENKIVRPFLDVSREQIDEYIDKNAIPFVTDQTNFDDDYTRNHLRLNVIPQIKKVFPEMEKSLSRLADVVKIEDEFLDRLANESVVINDDTAHIKLPCAKALFNRAVVIALKGLGVKKDWEKSHIDSVYSLTEKQNGAKVNLLCGITAIREYDKITFCRFQDNTDIKIPFLDGNFSFGERNIAIKKVAQTQGLDLKSGLYLDFDKIPHSAVIRTPQNGDVFTKFGGGTKKLCDYLTDKKIPQRLRASLPVIADDNVVYAIFGISVSELSKVDEKTKTIVEII
ncbi:MAG: tRNA lysidine(34) synthetase TilS [Clostridia bacterium]|nr:tRNA lysidine(34) synthetase TilS [Clostridia bacterium]